MTISVQEYNCKILDSLKFTDKALGESSEEFWEFI